MQQLKKISLVLLVYVLGVIKLYSQNIDSLTYNMTQDLNVTQQMGWFSPTELKVYVSASGNKLKLGDTLYLGSPSSNASYAVGGTLRSNNSSTPSVLTRNAGIYMFVKTGEHLNNTGAGILNSEVGSVLVVSDIVAAHTRNSKNSPMDIKVLAKSVRAQKFMGNNRRIITNYEKALEVGEIMPKNRKMTKAEALTLLKEKKELFELGVITKEEFEAIRASLTPILTGK